jgi:tRNA-dihydrouridine synthase B
MAEGARVAEGAGADIIDINMGCPAKKVTGGHVRLGADAQARPRRPLIEATLSRRSRCR